MCDFILAFSAIMGLVVVFLIVWVIALVGITGVIGYLTRER
jgi:hypothetical protein